MEKKRCKGCEKVHLIPQKMEYKEWNHQKTYIGQLSDSSSVDAYKRWWIWLANTSSPGKYQVHWDNWLVSVKSKAIGPGVGGEKQTCNFILLEFLFNKCSLSDSLHLTTIVNSFIAAHNSLHNPNNELLLEACSLANLIIDNFTVLCQFPHIVFIN